MVVYDSAHVYIQSKKSLAEKVTAVQEIIDALDGQLLVLAMQDSPLSEYMLNDGQTTIRAYYRTTSSIVATQEALERRKWSYINQINGRVVRMVDSKNFIGNGYIE